MKRFHSINPEHVYGRNPVVGALVGWDGCENRLCDPCACVSCVCPGSPPLTGRNPNLADFHFCLSPGMAEPVSSVAHLSSELAALRARQAALLPVLRHRNQTNQSLIDNVDAVFARVPEYIAKLAEVQHSMDMLAARTANMRRKCENLVSSDL